MLTSVADLEGADPEAVDLEGADPDKSSGEASPSPRSLLPARPFRPGPPPATEPPRVRRALRSGGERGGFSRIDCRSPGPELESRRGDQRDHAWIRSRARPQPGGAPGARPKPGGIGHRLFRPLEAVRVVRLAGDGKPGHSGTLPCLRCGTSVRFVASMARLRASTLRVSSGEITSST